MGCFQSKDASSAYQESEPHKQHEDWQHQGRKAAAGNGEAAVAGKGRSKHGHSSSAASKHSAGGGELDTPRRHVSFAGGVKQESEGGRRPSRAVQPRTHSFVGADLHSIMDEHGMLNPLVSRQLSVMSHYSVRSESGSVMITPEQTKAPFELIRLIGRGGFGNVYLGDWDGEKIAVKVIAGNNSPDLLPEEAVWEARKERMAQMEAVLMSAIHHPNIVNTYKVTSHSGDDVDADLLLIERKLLANAGGDPESGIPSFEWHILMEYCDKGSLSKLLASFKLHTPLDGQTVGWHAWTCLEVLKEMAEALKFLHEHRIIHGDLKAANVLLASSDKDKRGWESKLADFGLSRVIAANCPVIKTHTFGTVTHMPPELLSRGRLLPSSDVYAFGVLMWEVYTGEKVFKQLSDSEVILAVVTKRARPTFPSDTPSRYRFLAEKCWAEMHELRPSLKHILNELDNLQKMLCPQGQDSEPVPCRVYPSRMRMLDQFRQQIAANQAAAQAHVTAQAQQSMTSVRPEASTVTRKPPKPGQLEQHRPHGTDKRFKHSTSQDITQCQSENQISSKTIHSESNAIHGHPHQPQRSNKSFGAALTRTPEADMVDVGERAQSIEGGRCVGGHKRQVSAGAGLPSGETSTKHHEASQNSPKQHAHTQPAGSQPSPRKRPSQLGKQAHAGGERNGDGHEGGQPVSAVNMPLHPSLISPPARPSALKTSYRGATHTPRQSASRASPGQVRFDV